jgi:hypothetical protein
MAAQRAARSAAWTAGKWAGDWVAPKVVLLARKKAVEMVGNLAVKSVVPLVALKVAG